MPVCGRHYYIWAGYYVEYLLLLKMVGLLIAAATVVLWSLFD